MKLCFYGCSRAPTFLRSALNIVVRSIVCTYVCTVLRTVIYSTYVQYVCTVQALRIVRSTYCTVHSYVHTVRSTPYIHTAHRTQNLRHIDTGFGAVPGIFTARHRARSVAALLHATGHATIRAGNRARFFRLLPKTSCKYGVKVLALLTIGATSSEARRPGPCQTLKTGICWTSVLPRNWWHIRQMTSEMSLGGTAGYTTESLRCMTQR